MTPFQTPFELMWSDRLQGATDLYQVLLTLKHGFGNGESTLGCYSITKADAKRAADKAAKPAEAVESKPADSEPAE